MMNAMCGTDRWGGLTALGSHFTTFPGAQPQAGMKWAFGPLVNTLQIPIPLPPLATQRAIVAEIEAEQALVSANRELITRFEQKIQTTLARVWGEEGPSATPHASPVRRARPQAPPPPVAEEADEEAEAGSEEGAEKEHPSAEAEEGSTTAPLRPTRPDEMDKSDFMSLLRDVLTEHGPCDRDTVIKQAATSLGYQRVRGGLAGILANAIRTAVRRQVLLNGGNIYSVNRAGIADLDMEFLKTQFLAAISEQGRVWTTREDATRAFARWFGFRRTGSVIDETARKLIPRLLRAGRLEKDGDSIKRV